MFENMKRYAEFGPVLLRLGVVFSFLLHGIPKLMDFAATSQAFTSMGFPGFLGPVVGIFEVVGAILLFIGLWTRLAALWLAVIMAVALLFVHIPTGQGYELPFILFLMNLALFIRGSGKWAVDSA